MENFILTNISKLNPGAPFSSYSTTDMGKIRGRYTNEAPVKYLLNTIHYEEAYSECSIIAITTKEAEEAFQAFRRTIRRYCSRKGYKQIKIEKISFGERKFGSVLSRITETIKIGDRVYIDTTGSYRDSQYLLMAAVRMLEYSGVRLEKAVYSVYNRNNLKENKIVDITETYKMFNLINAANSFTSLGNSNELEEFFFNCENAEVKSVIDVMKLFSDDVALCRTSRLDNLLSELNEALTKLQNMKTTDENVLLFKMLAAVIREKFKLESEDKIDYVGVIRWCLDNKMIQQAVTIFVEKLPEYLFSKGIISHCLSEKEISKFPKTFDVYYNFLYNGFLQQVSSITRSPYPIGNLLLRLKSEETSAFKEICNASSINELSFERILTSNERGAVLRLIRVKNAIFAEPNKKRTPEEIEKKKQNSKLKDFINTDIFDTSATTSESFVNSLLKDADKIKLLQGEFARYTPKVWTRADINVIEHLERILKENQGSYSVSKKIPLESLKEVLMEMIYVKRYVRNTLNHASEEKRLSSEYDEYFSSRGYCVSSELSVREIETILNEALNLIKSLSV